MRLRKNPFYLLEVTPEDSIEKINEAAENKSFIDDKNEQLYEEARLVLSSPSKRIAAEIRYIFSDSSDDGMVSLFYDPSEERISIDDFLRNPYDCFYEDDNRYSCYEELIRGVEWLYLDNYCSDADEDEDSVELDEQDFANFIAVIAEQYSYLLDSDNVKELTNKINVSRSYAGFPLLEDNSNVLVEAIRSLENDLIDAINDMFSRLSDDKLIKIFNIVAEDMDTINGDVVKDAINIYAVKFKDLLENQKDTIIAELDELHEKMNDGMLNQLCNDVRYFDYVAQPIQVYLLLNGQSDLQVESVTVASAVRDFALGIFKNEKNSKVAKELLDLEIELFSELPELFETIKQDRFVVGGLSSCMEAMDRCDNNPKGAVVIISELFGQAEKSLSENEIDDDLKEWISDYFAAAMIHCVIAYGNATLDWDECLKVMHRIQQYITDEETQKRYDENLEILQNNNEAGYRKVHYNISPTYSEKPKRSDNHIMPIIGFIGIVALALFIFFNVDSGDKSKTGNTAKPPVTSSQSNKNSATKKSEPKQTESKKANATVPIPKSGVRTGYDNSKQQLAYGGNASITIDNSRNDMPVYVRIWDVYSHTPVRAFYIAKGGMFTAEEMEEGTYEVRYVELYDNNVAPKGSKSQQFDLEDDGYTYSEVTITLYKVANGNMHTSSIPASDI